MRITIKSLEILQRNVCAKKISSRLAISRLDYYTATDLTFCAVTSLQSIPGSLICVPF